MNKNILIGIVVGIVLVIGGGLFVLNQQNRTSSEEIMQKKDDANFKENQSMNTTDSRYIEYSKANFDSASGMRRVLFFYANWCPICRPADTDFKSNSSRIPQDMTVLKVNYNDTDTDEEEKDLAQKYNITYQHTFVQIDADGNELARWSGGSIDELLDNIK